MKCVICKNGETESGSVTVSLQRGETTILIKDVPADICVNCGEYYLSDVISEQVLNQAEATVSKNAEVEILRFAA